MARRPEAGGKPTNKVAENVDMHDQEARGDGAPPVAEGKGGEDRSGAPAVPVTIVTDNRPVSWYWAMLVAGLGGTLPTISRIASEYATEPNQPLPDIGLYYGLALFFIIGGILDVVMGEFRARNALFIGISAPAIITSITYGIDQQGNLQLQTSDPRESAFFIERDEIIDRLDEDFYIPARHMQVAPRGTSVGVGSYPYGGLVQEPIEYSRQSDLPSISRDDILLAERMLRINFSEQVQTMDNIRFFVLFTTESNNSVSQLIVNTSRSADFSAVIPRNATGVSVILLDNIESIDLPQSDFASVDLNYSASIRTTNDFWWAIGLQRRRYEVDAAQLSLTSSEPAVRAGTGFLIPTRYVYGITASVWQQEIDWDALGEAGMRFAILRATYGTRPDQNVDKYWETFLSSEQYSQIAVGFYHFFRFGQDINAQAEAFLSQIDDKQSPMHFPLFVALYRNDEFDTPITADNYDNYVNQVSEFMSILDERTSRPIYVHTSRNFIEYLATLGGQHGIDSAIASRIGDLQAFTAETIDEYSWLSSMFIWEFAIVTIPGIPVEVQMNVLLVEPGLMERFNSEEDEI